MADRPPADAVVGEACAALDAGKVDRGTALAREACRLAQEAQDPRGQVLALLALARVPEEAEAAIHAAAAVADHSNDRNLVFAVVRASKAAGVVLPPKVF